ncbi:hypothetical protein DL768_009266 [Monosporascus sp. mg162]|nr:hypothetical protein DL768_009266 [Monosporascus sp. mg162]
MAAWIRRIGEVLGVRYPTIAYDLRTTCGITPPTASIRATPHNLALDNANSDPLQRHYLGRQAASINTHPRVRALTKKLRTMRPGAKRRDTVRELRILKQKLRRDLKQRIRDAWADEQAVEDIERQLQGLEFAELMAVAMGATHRSEANDAIGAINAYCPVEEGRTARRNHSPSNKKFLAHPNGEPSEESPVDGTMLSIFVEKAKRRRRR